MKGRTAPVAVYQWVARQAEAADAAPFVGRGDELRRLQSAMDDALSTRTARLVTVIGDPGVGKSRLAAEYASGQRDARVVEARCVLEGTVALGPLVEVLRASDLETDVPPGIPERDRLLRDLDGLASGVPGSVEENFWALRRFIEVLATSQPVVLVLDDIQWADTLLLDFIEHLVEWVKDVSVLVLALARPELRDIRPELVAVSRWASEAVHLGGLDAGATAELAAKVLGTTRLPDELLNRLPSSTGGNPLFVRELIGMLAHDGVLVEEPHGWRLTIDVDAISIPPTIHALLASRLERLEAADRRVLEIASVVGSDFSVGAVRALTNRSAEGIKLSLNRLRRLELAQPSGAYVGDEPVWRFHHVLIRDVAYRRLLKSDRADLHERLADWVAEGGQSVAVDPDEMVARHLEAAYTYRSQLGPRDDQSRDLAVRSARRYAASARRALDRDELVFAGTQAARGAALAASDEALHADLLLIGCEAFLSAGDVTAGAPLVDELESIADDNLAPWATCYRCQFVIYTDPERLLEVEARLHDAIAEFSRRKDPAGLAKAHRVRAGARGRLGRIGDSEIDLFEALIAARESGDHRQITAALGAAPGAALWGPSPVPKAGGRCLDVVRMQRMTTAAPSLEATSLRHLAVLELLRGRPDKARTMLADAHQVVADLGLRHGVMETELFAGIIEMMEGDAVAAEPHFRTALEGLDALGVGADAGQAAAFLARSVLAQGRIDEADRYATESERLAGRNLKTAIAWRAVRAEILAAQSRHADAAAMAREAVAVAAGTDLVLDHAEACLALSRVLASVGDTKGAGVARSDAEALYVAKEVTARVDRIATSDMPSPPGGAEAESSRLALANRASRKIDTAWRAFQSHDIDGALTDFSDQIGYDDHRRFSGVPVKDIAELHTATARAREQFPYTEWVTLAVRGERLELRSIRMWDDAGNESTTFNVFELDEREHIQYWGRFDDDDFESAYRELDERYYAGEGAPFAESGTVATNWTLAVNRADFDTLFGELTAKDFHLENRSRSAFPDRSAPEYRTTLEDLAAMVVSARAWPSVMSWVSPNWCVARCERDAVGKDGEKYAWHFLIAFEFRDGRVASMCEFELDDEHAAFAYVADRLRKSTSRLRINNRASELAQAASQALQAHDVDALRVEPAAHFVYDDRRRITGDPIRDAADLHAATERILDSYPHTEWRTIAVRGDRLEMHWSRLWDDDGNEARTLNVMEFDGAGRLEYFGRFEEDDFGGAYRELDRRYYAGEGAAFAEAGAVGTEWAIAVNDGDYVKAFGELIGPDASFENRSRSAFPDPSISALGTTYQDLNTVDGRTRTWPSVLCPLSPTVGVARLEQETTGRDGERYTWTWISVTEIQGGRFASACLFELDDEEAAFAYAEERMRASLGRLSVTNASCDILPGFFNALRAHDVDSALGHYADEYEYDDHRRLGGAPVVGRDAMRAAMKRLLEDYSHFEFRVLAVRGQRLHLVWSRLSDDEGNESITYYVDEVDDNGKITYHGRFDEGDFEAAYRELERRYYTGEGAAFAENGLPASDAPRAISQDDLDTLFGNIMSADARVETRSRRAFPDRSASELRAGFEALNTLVTSKRVWNSAVAWISPTCSITRLEREAIGIDGETYRWSMILVTEHRGGLVTSICEFDPDDEDGAFAYVEQRVQAQSSRLAVTNQASETAGRFFDALRARDSERAAACYSEQFVYADRRSLSGDPIAGRDGMRLGVERMLAQFTQYDFRVLAVRGQNLLLAWNCESDADGNTTGGLTVFEAENGLITYHGRFDEDDFNGAYRELDRRYFAGEGAAFAQSGATATDAIMALNTSDFDRLLGELCTPDMRVENRTRSAFPDRSITDLRASFGQLDSMVTSTRSWLSSQYWITPNRAVGRLERDATGDSGEQYAWSRVLTIEFRDGLMASMCEFEVDDEAAAFAYIDEKARQPRSRLALTNRSVESADKLYTAMNARDIDATMETISGEFVYDDRRRLSGDPVNSRAEVRAAFKRVLDHYCRFESRILAVRGDRLHLHWARWSDDSGNEAVHLHVFGVDNDGLQDYEGRFDEDDFEGAYREFEHRYYSGEGAAFALAGAVAADYVLALHRMDLDTLFGELTSPDFRLENRSGSAFNDRSAAELRASFEDLDAMMASQQLRHSVVRWVSPTVMVARFDREGVGHGGERYAWSQIDVGEIRDGWCTRACQFDLEQEEAAFAYAEEWAAQTTNSRLAVTNRSCELTVALNSALHETDIDAVMRCFSNSLVYDDRRRLSGDPIHDHAGFRTAFERICDQYNQFEYRFLAVRGDRLNLSWSRWSDNAGNETAYLHVCEIGDDGLIAYEGRFDEDAFEGAYRELERRFYAGEGAAFAEAGAIATEVVVALNRGDFDKVFGELTDPDAPIENRSRLPFPNRSTNMLRASFEDLDTMVASTRIWFSALCWVSNSWGIVRFEREAVGKDGEQYRWTHLVAAEIRNGRIASMCEFEVDDEAAAFAYAEERVRPAENR